MSEFQLSYHIIISVPEFDAYASVAGFLVPKLDANTRSKIEFLGNDITFKGVIHRNNFAEANLSEFKLYNLNRKTRLRLQQDYYELDPQTTKTMEVYIGYAEGRTLVFSGYFRTCYSEKQGTDYVTTIKAIDVSLTLYRTKVAFSAPPGTKENQIINIIEDKLKFSRTQSNTAIAEKGISRTRVFWGDVADVLTEYYRGGFFIENNRLFLKDESGKITEVPTATITDKSGLLSTPIRNGTQITFDTTLKPNIFVGQIIQLFSENNLFANGIYAVIGLKHELHISSREKGQSKTTLTLNAGLRY